MEFHQRSMRFRGICGAALAIGLLGVVIPSAFASTSARTVTAKPTVVNVIAGKPSELAFKVTNFSNLTAGTIIFKVKNEGVAYHDFKLCTAPVSNTTHNSCVGTQTKLLHPGQTATLTVKITKKGKYEYLCSVPGHAAAGMKGLIGVGVKVTAPKVTPTVPVATTTTTAMPTTTAVTTTTSATTTTATPPPGSAGNDGCPPGETVQGENSQSNDQDADNGGGPDDGDGCI